MLKKIIFLSVVFFLQLNMTSAQFVDIAAIKGINHQFNGNAPGAGVSFIDVNKDGWDDLTLADLDGVHFYENSSGTFFKKNLNIIFEGEAKHVLWVDIDNDDDFDLFITGFETGNKLYRQDDGFVFEDITSLSGIPEAPKRHFGACFGDIDRDGDLDLYYTQQKLAGTSEPNMNRLFINDGLGFFTEITMSSGTADFDKLPFSAVFVDVNNDQWPDIYIANAENTRNTLLVNNRNLTFTDASEYSNSGLENSSLSVAPGDYNNDGYQDIYIANDLTGNALFENQGLQELADPLSIKMNEIAESLGIDLNSNSAGSQFLDCDNDGDLDIYVSEFQIGIANSSSGLLINNGEMGFSNNSFGFIGDTVSSFSNACGDIDNDGLAEIAVQNHLPYSFQLWRNTTTRNFIKLELQGIESNRAGIGARIISILGDERQYKEVGCGSGFLGQNSQQQIIGMGSAEKIDSVKVRWPSGHIDVWTDLVANEKYTLVEGATNNNVINVDSQIIAEGQKLFVPSQKARLVDHFSRHKSLMGGGAAFADFNGDGYDDIYLTGGRDKDQLLIFDPDRGTFDNLAEGAGIGITDSIYTLGVAVGDMDNDGHRDIFVATWTGPENDLYKNLLFHNQGDGTFKERWPFNSEFNNFFSIGATLLDYDNDGLLDIYVGNYVKEVKFLYDENNQIIGYDHDCFTNILYRNKGNMSFERLPEFYGVSEKGCSLAMAATDYNDDGNMDLLVANDFGPFIEPNKLYENQLDENGNFKNVSVETMADFAIYGMGIAVGDIDFDLDMDYYITNFGRNLMMENQNGMFVDITDDIGVADEWSDEAEGEQQVGWGTSFLDADNDMDLDLFVSNGYVPSPAFLDGDILEQDKLFIRNDDGAYTDDGLRLGIDNHFVSRGMATGDFDQDGDVDIISVVLNVPQNDSGWETTLFENTLNGSKNWLGVKLEGVTVNRDAIGSKAIAYVDGLPLMRVVDGGSSHCGQNSSILHFGLADHQSIDSLVIWWTGKKQKQIIEQLEINQLHHIVQDTSSATTSVSNWTNNSRLNISPNPNQGVFNVSFIDQKSGQLGWEQQEIRVINLDGREMPTVITRRADQSCDIEILNATPGIYLLKILTSAGDKNYIAKIIVQ